MPHLTLEYSANLGASVDLDGLCKNLCKCLSDSGLFELGAIRVRAVRCDTYAIADELPENAFLDASLHIGAGRTPEEKKRAGEFCHDDLQVAVLLECLKDAG